jgi:hypothetical protein
LALGKEAILPSASPQLSAKVTVVSFRTAVDGRLPSAFFVECQTLGKHVFAECGPVPSVLRSVKRLVTESQTLPSAALGKAFFAECGSRQSLLCRVPDKRHLAKNPTLGKALDFGIAAYLFKLVTTDIRA